MGSTRAKTEFLHEHELREFLCQGGRHYLHTWTFAENITDKAEASRRFAPIDDWYRRHGVSHIDTWERQKRGAWHCHCVVDRFCNVRELRLFAVARGWGSQSPDCKVIGRGGVDVLKTAHYLAKYLSKASAAGVPRFVRLTGRTTNLRGGSVRFGWVGGYARVWRLGRDLFARLYCRAPTWRESGSVAWLAVQYLSDEFGREMTLDDCCRLEVVCGELCIRGP